MLEKATVPSHDFGAGVSGQDFERLGAIYDWSIWDGVVAEN